MTRLGHTKLWWTAALLSGLAACGDEETSSSVELERAFELEPTVMLRAAHGTVSATGAVRQETFTITASHDGSVKLLVGPDCDPAAGVALGLPFSVKANTPHDETFPASGPLTAEGFYEIQACFEGKDGKRARSVVQLKVDNTAPMIAPTLAAGEYCGPVYVQLFCTDCYRLAYSTTGEVSFGADWSVASGTLYTGQQLFIGADTTLRFKGLDPAGNETSGNAVFDISSGPPINNVATGNRYLSVNGRTSTTLSFNTTTAGHSYEVRDDATNCNTGSLIAAGTTVSGTNSVTIDAFDIDSGDNELMICVQPTVGCPGAQTALLTRKDFSLGWTFAPTSGTPWTPLTFFYMYPRDTVLSLSSPTYSATHRIDGVVIDVRETIDASALSAVLPADRYILMYDQDFMAPENADGSVALAITGITDEAQNDVSDISVAVSYGSLDRAIRINRTPFTASGAVVTSPSGSTTWTRCPAGQTYDTTGGVCTGTATTHTWTSAISACAALNAAAFNGTTQWRLPYIWELASTVDTDAAAAPFTETAFTMPTETRFWSGTGQDSSSAYALNFANTAATRLSKGTSLSVRCVTGTTDRSARSPVRSSWSSGSGAFVPDSSGPVILEQATGLAWDQAPSTSTVSAATAATACNGTRHATTGWRLPTAAHFLSVMALRYGTNGLINGGGFTGGTTQCYWIAGATGFCYRPNTGALESAGTSHPVWCVREQP